MSFENDDAWSTPFGNLPAEKRCGATAYQESGYTDSAFINTAISISSAVGYFATPTGAKCSVVCPSFSKSLHLLRGPPPHYNPCCFVKG